MSRDLRGYLQQPDKLFRRVRDAYGVLRLSQAAKAYHPGRGVYRSSYKNARRLAATETNIAYHTADYLRWQQLDFVVGIRVELSNNHTLNGRPFHDICDELSAPRGSNNTGGRGCYPKDFKFTGWHPLCRCHALTILKTDDEIAEDTRRILAGEPTDTGSVNRVDDMPQEFKGWVDANSDRIERAKSLPYFIKDNKQIVEKILHPKPTVLEIARMRHESRTPEQIESIKNRWAEREKKHTLIKKTADNVLKVATDYGEVDYSKLQQYIAAGNLTAMQSEAKIVAKSVAAVKKQEQTLSTLIPDAHGWHKQFTMNELQKVYDAVKSKLDSLSSLTLEEQAKKLQFEIKYVADPSKYKAGAIKYQTWEVSQSAYIKELASVNYKIDYNAQAEILDEIDKWSKQHPKSLKVKSLLDKATAAWSAKGDMLTIKAKVAAAKAEMDKRIAEQARRDAKKIAKNGGAAFGADAYSKVRKDSALWSNKKDKRGLYDRENGDAYFRQFAEEDWKRWNENEKDVAYLYTSGSSYINEPTYTTYYSTKYGLKGEVRDSWKDINTLTKMINESTPFTRDVWLNRGAGKGEFMGQFGLDLDNYTSNPNGLVGSIGEHKPFMSTAHSKSWGFVDNGKEASRSVVYNIYCPKGTKGIYTEPYSAFGNMGRNWDGKTKAPLANEVEVILQRGTRLRVIKAEYKNGQWFIDMEVIEQPTKLPNQP